MMRLSDEQREARIREIRECPEAGYTPNEMTILDLADELALAYEAVSVREADLIRQADELAAMREEAETQFMANADVIRNHEQTRKELAAAHRREKRLKRQVELMGWLIGSHEADIHELAGYAKVRGGWPSFDQMGDPSDEGEYTDDDLDMLKDHWPAAREELLRRQMAADNHDHRDDAARHAWEEGR